MSTNEHTLPEPPREHAIKGRLGDFPSGEPLAGFAFVNGEWRPGGFVGTGGDYSSTGQWPFAEAVRAEDGADEIPEDFTRALAEVEAMTPPAEPAPLNNLFACPTCNGWHFNISRGGTLVCTSRGNVGTVGCGWRGSLEQPPRQEGETPDSKDLNEAVTRLATMLGISLEPGWDANDWHVLHVIDTAREQVPMKHAAERRAADAEASKETMGKQLGEALVALSMEESRSNKAEAAIAGEARISDSEMMALLRRRVKHLEAEAATEPDPADTLPSNARFVEVEKPHPDSLRLRTALEQSQELLITCLHETGAAEYRAEIEQQCHENRTLLNQSAPSATKP